MGNASSGPLAVPPPIAPRAWGLWAHDDDRGTWHAVDVDGVTACGLDVSVEWTLAHRAHVPLWRCRACERAVAAPALLRPPPAPRPVEHQVDDGERRAPPAWLAVLLILAAVAIIAIIAIGAAWLGRMP